MNCRRFLLLASRELDGRLSSAERRGLDEHLAVCPACRAQRELWLSASAALRARGAAAVPPDLATRAWRTAVASARSVSLLDGFVSLAARLAIAAAVAAAGVWGGVIVRGDLEAAWIPADPVEIEVALWAPEAVGDGD